jgi:hypothetical protein
VAERVTPPIGEVVLPVTSGYGRGVIMRRIVVATSIAVVLGAGTAVGSDDPPPWALRKAVCPRVNFMTADSPSGQVGEAGGGYNVYYLVIVAHRGVSCARARTLARKAWITGEAPPLHWRMRRQWRTSAGGSAWVGDFVGTARGKRVEYLAVH